MALFPCSIPDIPEQRAEIVPARLARKIGPLFGVPWAQSPFPLVWVCDFSSLTINEIARGAPSPQRKTAAEWGARLAPEEFRIVDRALVTHRATGSGRPEPAPNELANATINRFGPDTKAALVLAGTNKLLEPVTDALRTALVLLRSAQDESVPLVGYLGAWAALVLEAFRSQPALIRAALQAREVQRALRRVGGLPYDRRRDRAEAEFESGYADGPTERDSSQPMDLDLFDATVLAALDPELATAGRAARADGPTKDLAQALVDALAKRLQALGSSDGDGHLWIRDDGTGHRSAHAFVPHDPFLLEAVSQIRRIVASMGWEAGPSTIPLPTIPLHLPGSVPTVKRAVLHGLSTMTWLAFGSGDPDPMADLAALGVFDRLHYLAQEDLGSLDPGTAFVQTRVADMRLEVIRQDATYDRDLPDAINRLKQALDSAVELADQGALDPALAADQLFSGNVELLAVLRRHTPDTPIPGVEPPGQLVDWLYRSWANALRLLDQPEVAAGELPASRTTGFFLHNYASFLAGRADEAAEYGLRLFESVVIPSRERYYRRTGSFDQLLFALQNASRAATRLSAAAAKKSDKAAARAYARTGRDMISRSLGSRYVTDMLDRAAVDASDEACRFALLAVPALLTALQAGASEAEAADVDHCELLLDVATRFADRIAKGGGTYGRLSEILYLRAELDAYRARLAVPGRTP